MLGGGMRGTDRGHLDLISPEKRTFYYSLAPEHASRMRIRFDTLVLPSGSGNTRTLRMHALRRTPPRRHSAITLSERRWRALCALRLRKRTKADGQHGFHVALS